MFYIIYQTTNKINGKIYIGKHKTAYLNDGYIGSGKILKQAIKKYGLQNFTCELLFSCENEEDMNNKEKEIVSDTFLERGDVYNLKIGGNGGFDYARKHVTKESHIKKGKTFSKNYSDGKIVRKNGFEGKHHTEEHKIKHALFMSLNQSGSGNSQYGTIWITNGSQNKKLKRTETIPDGWYKGRK